MNILPLFCEIDDFFLAFEKYQAHRQLPGRRCEKRGRPRTLHPSEVMTILVNFHQSQYRTFKDYYLKEVCLHLRWAFPHLVSYNRFVALKSEVMFAASVYLYTRLGGCDGVSFIDSTRLRVCENRRIPRHRVLVSEEAGRGMTSMGWFYGFKLHLVINTHGELLSVYLTSGNTDDRRPVLELARPVFGKLYADKGYISKELRQTLKSEEVDLIYKVRKNMKAEALSDFDALMLKKRMLIETVIGQLKSRTQLEHTRHRSFQNFQVNIVSALIAYTHQEKKPTLNLYVLDAIKEGLLAPENP